jgi:long-chain acyl-CoA synthetase
MYESKPWLKFYGSTPHTIEYPRSTICGAVHQAALSHPAVPALKFMGTVITHAELDRRIAATSRALAAAGMKPGDHVLVCMPNVPQAVIVFYALNRLGRCPP